MNIFYDQTIFQQMYGGISRYFREVIFRLLDKENVDIHLFMGLFVNQYWINNEKTHYKSYWGLEVPPVYKTGPARRFVNEIMWRLFQAKFAPKGGLGSIYHPTYYKFSGMPRAKVVFTVYDLIHERFNSKDKTIMLKQKAFERADTLICISDSTKNDLLNLYPSIKCNTKTIYLGYNDMSLLAKCDDRLPAYPYFLFVGPRYSYKNFECLLEAFTLSPSLKKDFGIVCFGGTAFSDKEKKRFAELGIAYGVTRFGGSDDILASLYKNAVAFVYPSLYEGFGIPPLEAMSCDCPVIASNTSSIPEVVGDAALLFTPTSAENLANELHKIAFDRNIRTQLIESGQKRRSLFSWNRCAEETLALYKELLQA